jgi:leader peptidase (prepilin peptidase)/N-methyltransferase
MFAHAIELWPGLAGVLAVFAALYGACIGSFLNVCIYRIPRDESVVRPRSHCPHCNRLIPWYLNIPLLSWVLLRGRCRFCNGPIAARYVLVELLTAILFLAVFLQWAPLPRVLGFQPLPELAMVPIYWVFLAGLVLGTFVDFEHMIIPDSVTIGGIVAGLVFSVLVPALHGATDIWTGLLRSAIGAGVGFGGMFLIAEIGSRAFKKEAMGFGDVKLMGAIGAFLGWQAVVFTVLISSFLGSIVGVALIVTGRRQLQSQIPFGPYLSVAALIWVFWGPRLWHAYLTLLMVP